MKYISEIITMFLSGGVVWFWNNAKTKRDIRKIDFQNYNETVKELLNHNEILVQEIVKLQKLIIENNNEISILKMTIKQLECKITKLENKK
jgi:hypothetical protein